MRWIAALCLLLVSLPAVAEEGWRFDPTFVELRWADDRTLRPEEGGAPSKTDEATPIEPVSPVQIVAEAPNLWRVERRLPGAEGVAWSRTLHVDGVPPISGRMPSYVSAIAWHPQPTRTTRPSHPSHAGDMILSLGQGALITALDLRTGLVRWQLTHVWEFVRSRESPPNFVMRILRVRQPGERSRLLRDARVVAGPVVVPGEEEGYRVFVGVTEARRTETATPIEASRIYEIGSGGGLVSVTRLPRPLTADGMVAVDGGVLVQMDGGCVARFEPSEQSSGGWRGRGGTDWIGRMPWYVEPPTPKRRADDSENDEVWLTTEGEPSSGAAIGPYLVRAAAGACADQPSDGHWIFPLRRLDTRTGRYMQFELRLRFKGRIPPPEVNFSKSSTEDGTERYEAFTPHEAQLVDIAASEGRLALTVGTANGAQHRWLFALPDVPPRSEGDESATLPDAVTLEVSDPPRAAESDRGVAPRGPGWPEVRVMDPKTLLEDPEGRDALYFARLADLAMGERSALRQRAIAVIAELEAESVALLPIEALPDLLVPLAMEGYDHSLSLLVERLLKEDPDAAAAALARVLLRTHDYSTSDSFAQTLALMGPRGFERLIEIWRDRALNPDAFDAHRTWWARTFTDETDDPREAREAYWAALRTRLRDVDPQVRAAAAEELCSTKRAEARVGALEVAEELLLSAHVRVRRAGARLAVDCLRDGQVGTASLARALGRALETPDLDVVDGCLWALRLLGRQARTEIPALLKLALAGAPQNRRFAIQVLGFVARPTDNEVVTFLEGCLNHEDDLLRSVAAHALNRLAMDPSK